MFALRRDAGRAERRLDPSERRPPVLDAREIDPDALKFGDARPALLERDRAVVPDRRERRRLRARFVDVAPLRVARHHDCRPAPLLEALMDVAERPVVKAM